MSVVSLAGSEVSIFLLDGSQFILRITPATTAGAAVLAISEKIGLRRNACYSLYELGAEQEFRMCDDKTPLAKVMAKWAQSAVPSASSRLHPCLPPLCARAAAGSP